MTREELLARARQHMWAAWSLSSEELASQAADNLMGLGMLVPEGEAAELVRLRSGVTELEAAAYGDATVRLLTPVEQIRHLHSCVTAQMSRADTLDRLLREKQDQIAEREAAPVTVYRAEHPDSAITLGHYGTEAAARAHCEDLERRSWPTGTALAFDWIEDDEDRVAELVVTAGQNEESTTGYIVTGLELDSEYDAEADE